MLADGVDPVAFILSANVARRHMSKGQAAMAVARAQIFFKNRQTDAARATGVSQSRIAYASTVLRYAPEIADSVLAGATPLNIAYETAKARKQAEEERRVAHHRCNEFA